MKQFRSLAIVIALLGLGSISNVHAQGSLTPPGAPAPMMKSLSQIEPRTPISSLPYTITTPGSYYVTTNLTGASSGINIATGNVTLDLNGFTLQGGSSYCMSISGSYTNITVRNGMIVNWSGNGIDAVNYGSPVNVLLENLTVSGCGGRGISVNSDSIVRNCRCYGNSSVGIFSRGGEIVDCTARGNLGGGIYGDNATVRNCHAETNSSVGIECVGGSALDSASFNNNGYGISLYNGGSARRCHVQGNLNAGIYTVNYAPILGGVIADCVITTNNYGINLGAGGYMVTGNQIGWNPSAGIIIQSSDNRIDGNQILCAPSAYGISLTSLSYGYNVIVRNSVYGTSQANNYNILVNNNDLGPIGSASTNTSPWANISH